MMPELDTSLAILLSEEVTEPEPRKFLVTPLSGGESWLSTIGLTRHLNKLNSEIRHQPDQSPVELSMAVFSKLDEYRQRTAKFAGVLSPLESDFPGSRAYQAMHIAMLIQGQRLHKQQKHWPTSPYDQEVVLEDFGQLMSGSDTEFLEKKQWGYRRAYDTKKAWEQELTNNRGHRIVPILRQASALPKPTAVEV